MAWSVKEVINAFDILLKPKPNMGLLEVALLDRLLLINFDLMGLSGQGWSCSFITSGSKTAHCLHGFV